MTLQAVLESLDNVDDALKPLYVEKDDKFVLQVQGVENHPDTQSLVNAYERVKSEKNTLNEEVNGLRSKAKGIPEDFDMDVWSSAKSGKSDETAIAAAKAEVRAAMQAEVDEAVSKFKGLQTQFRQSTAEAQMTGALSKVGVNPDLFDGARAVFSTNLKFNDDNTPYMESPVGPLAIEEFAARWAAQEGKPYVLPAKGTDAKGGGTNGHGGKPPNRSQMTPEGVHEYVQEHGQEAYLQLPK